MSGSSAYYWVDWFAAIALDMHLDNAHGFLFGVLSFLRLVCPKPGVSVKLNDRVWGLVAPNRLTYLSVFLIRFHSLVTQTDHSSPLFKRDKMKSAYSTRIPNTMVVARLVQPFLEFPIICFPFNHSWWIPYIFLVYRGSYFFSRIPKFCRVTNTIHVYHHHFSS